MDDALILKVDGAINLSTAIRLAPHIAEITQPLSDALDVTYFHHARLLKDGSHFCLTNRVDFFDQYFYENCFSQSKIYYNNLKHCTLKQVIWRNADIDAADAQHLDVLKNVYNISNGIVIIKQHTQGIDFFSFAPSANNSHVYDNLVNHIQILDQYIPCYLEKAEKLIKLSEKNRTYVPHKKKLIFLIRCISTVF